MTLAEEELAAGNATQQCLWNMPSRNGLFAFPVNLPIAAICLLLLAIPALCLWMTPNILTQDGIDNYIYTGYIYNSASLLKRFNETYYVLRVAAILPQQIAHHLLSPEAAFVVVRYLLLLAGCSSMFAIIKRAFGIAPALYCALLFAFTPWYLHSITWEYVDGFAITYLLLGFACILAQRHPTYFGYFCAGALTALATNSNLYSISLAGAFIPVLIYLRLNDRWLRVVLDAAAATVGFVLGYVVLAQIVGRMIPGLGFFFESFTLKIAARLLSGESERWFQALGPYIAAGHFWVLVPPIVLLGALIYTIAIWTGTGPATSKRLMAAFSFYLALVTAIFLVNHYAFHSPRITREYYFSYAAIPTYLTLSAMIGTSAQRLPSELGAIILTAVATISLVIWFLDDTVHLYNHLSYVVFIAIAVLFLVGAAVAHTWPSFALAAVCIFGAALPSFFYHSGALYRELEDKKAAIEQRDTYMGALHLIHTIERVSPPSAGPIAFWYNSTLPAHSPLESLQSTYLFDYSRLHSTPPAIDDGMKIALKEKATLVLLALRQDEIASYESSLVDADVKFIIIDAGEYKGRDRNYAYAILKLLSAEPPANAEEIRGAFGPPVAPGSNADLNEMFPAELSTPAKPWAYGAQFAPHEELRGPLWIRLQVDVHSGPIGIGILNPEGNKFLSRTSVGVGKATVTLHVADSVRLGELVIQNWAQSKPARVRIDSVTVLKLRSSGSVH